MVYQSLNLKKLSKLFIYPKTGGNTFTVCDYVSKHTDIDVMCVTEHEKFQLDTYESIILCSGVYMGIAHAGLTKWLDNLEKTQLNSNVKFYMFMTWFGRGNSDKTAMEKTDSSLKKIGLKLEDNYATCFGKGMGLVRLGHPNTKDFEKILHWVKAL